MKSFFLIPLLVLSFLNSSLAYQWPLELKTSSGAVITIYQPQPESLNGNLLTGRAAFSAKEKPSDELMFGVFWFSSILETDRDERMASMKSIAISDIKLPGIDDTAKIEQLRKFLETEIPKWDISGSIDDITSTIEQEASIESVELKNDAPTIYYKKMVTTLVLMDGEPNLQLDKELKMKKVINTPFLIVENPADKKYYLYGGQYWYVSSEPGGKYEHTSSLPSAIAELNKQIKEKSKDKQEVKSNESSPPAILVSTVPAEVIFSRGEPSYANIEGTGLIYISNSDDDIFKYINDQKFYILLSGRWYSSPVLEGPWTYIASDQLPKDFSKIPVGSAKDNVLAFVAGTQASKEAVMDAQIPQTAKVDRKTATCTVEYDGDPKFEKIEGTSLELAMNTSSTVIKSGSKYYCVQTGVWFVASSAKGPWKVSDERPSEVDKIPAGSQAYNVKYVYIYDSTPDVVYVGYTPGYMGCYVYGPTVVYGTGYYYNPWYGPYYYPRPVTYGFSMHYNPWTGWSMGFHFSYGFFSYSSYHPGYWGPPMYRPPYYPPYRGGMYGGRGPTYIHGDVNINVGNSNNIYNRRKDVVTNDLSRGRNNTISNNQQNRNQNTKPTTRNNVYSGKDGNVYKRNDNGNWEQRNGNQWQKTQQNQNINKDYQNRQRSAQQNSNFNQMNRGGNLGGSHKGAGMKPTTTPSRRRN